MKIAQIDMEYSNILSEKTEKNTLWSKIEYVQLQQERCWLFLNEQW